MDALGKSAASQLGARRYEALLHYATFFIYGAAIANRREQILRWFEILPGKALSFMAMLVFLGYAYTKSDMTNIGRGWLLDVPIAAFSAGIIAISIAAPCLARSRLLQYLGKISFSLYLVHAAVGHFLFSAAGRTIPVSILATFVSLACADAVYRLIEAKSQRWSRAVRPGPISK